MRMAALSVTSDIPVATIKFYLREGLLHPGQRTSPNQSQYDATHVHRLRLIRALTEVGALSIAAAGDVLAAIDEPELPMVTAFAIAQNTVRSAISQLSDEDLSSGAESIDELIASMGWRIHEESAAKATATRVLGTLRALGLGPSASVLGTYARAAELVAKADLDTVQATVGRTQKVETLFAGTVLGDVLMAALRRMGQADYSSRLLADTAATTQQNP